EPFGAQHFGGDTNAGAAILEEDGGADHGLGGARDGDDAEAKRQAQPDIALEALHGLESKLGHARVPRMASSGRAAYSATRAISYVRRPDACLASLTSTCLPTGGSTRNALKAAASRPSSRRISMMAAARPLPDFLTCTTVACRICTSSVLSARSTWRTRKNVRRAITATAAATSGTTRRAPSRQTSALSRRALSSKCRLASTATPARHGSHRSTATTRA